MITSAFTTGNLRIFEKRRYLVFSVAKTPCPPPTSVPFKGLLRGMKPTPRRKSVWQERMPRRKRSLLKSSRVQEEVEEKSGDRRSGLRQAKEAKRKDNGVTNGIWYVTCENKEGVMDIEKLKRGESCIKCDGLWFTPPAFEEFAGRGACKKWKASIFHERRPLIHWFDKGILSTTGYLRRGAEPVRKIKSTKSGGKFQGILRNKYLRSSTAVTRRSMSSGGCSATEKAEITSREDSGAKGDSHQSDEDEKLNDDPNQMETEDGALLAAADYSKDHNGTKERHKDVDLVKTKKPELQIETKVIIKRLSVTKTESGATVLPVEDSWCEPLEANVPSEEPEDDTAVPEADGEGTVKELNSSSGVSTTPAEIDTSDNGDKTGLSAAPLNVLLECVYNNNTDEGKTEHDKAEVETSGKCVQVADYPRASERVQDGASGGPEGADVDALDLDQLKREKLKLQLRVLRLQEQYYTLMLNDFKK
ncbi:uncharacterized protein LOC105933507 isoform X2 [Fundulus heteroclitus]|uniref:uncharacterized protein LOC105933507 isoform X2 n=1 Tax=Fundulus heteroclitus TaxID=8078 RepID=UPI00165C6038|nr:uncharacterized protein LOC105933507 isoform X2 [Fundulus heteroclitus]